MTESTTSNGAIRCVWFAFLMGLSSLLLVAYIVKVMDIRLSTMPPR